MSKVATNMSMSLDGYIAGPNDSVEQGLGEGGERLHEWMMDLESWREQHGMEGGTRSRESELLEEGFGSVGALVMGRRMFDLGEIAWGDPPPFHVPVYVVTHRPKETLVRQGGTTYIFVTDGIESALKQARAAAGDKHVGVAGGANVIQQLLKAGLLDEIHISLIPVLFGAGTRLFDQLGTAHIELEKLEVVDSPNVTHLRYRVVK